jgi:phosphate transport system substrate-binding protein
MATALSTVITLAACQPSVLPAATPTSARTTLRLYATTSSLPLANDLVVGYARVQPNISFDVQSANYDALLARLLAGEVPYFLTTYLPPEGGPLSPFEPNATRPAGQSLWAAPLAQDAIAIIVNPANPVRGLTLTQVRDIYQGLLVNWSEAGSSNGAIIPFSREPGADIRAEFDALLMGARPIMPSARIAPSSEAMVDAVSRNSGTIGMVSLAYLDNRTRALPIDGIAPSPRTVADQTYPLRSIIYVVGLREPDGSQPGDLDYRAFFAWAQSAEGQAIAARRYAPLLGG